MGTFTMQLPTWLIFWWYAMVVLWLYTEEYGKSAAPQFIVKENVHLPIVKPPIKTANWVIVYDSVLYPVPRDIKKRVVVVRREYFEDMGYNHVGRALARRVDPDAYDYEVLKQIVSNGLWAAKEFWIADFPVEILRQNPELERLQLESEYANSRMVSAEGFATGRYLQRDELYDHIQRSTGEEKKTIFNIVQKKRAENKTTE